MRLIIHPVHGTMCESIHSIEVLAKDKSRLDKFILEGRRNAEKRATGYREQALATFNPFAGPKGMLKGKT
jgi:hypothetical protein